MPTTLRVGDMSCDGCEDIVQTSLEEVSGVESASADHEAGTAVVEGDPALEDLIDAVDHAGYSAETVSAAEAETESVETEAAPTAEAGTDEDEAEPTESAESDEATETAGTDDAGDTAEPAEADE